jgi:uncharacterized protein
MADHLSLLEGNYYYMCDYNQIINSEIKDIFLENGENLKPRMEDKTINVDTIKEQIRLLPQLIFEISGGCNLRCKYCIYGGSYENQRDLNNNLMSFDTARKAIDYIFPFIQDRPNKVFTLSFYGGEPLLNLDTVKQVVEYAKKKFKGWQLVFNMTTNLTMMNDDILEYWLENNFLILVSLDGSKENHDAKRVFPNGKGSHDVIIKNLKKIADRDNEYFKKRVGFSAVHSLDLSMKNVHQFFTETDFIRENRLRLSSVNTYNTTYYEHFPYDPSQLGKDFQYFWEVIEEKIRMNRELSGFESYLFNTSAATGTSLDARNFSPLGGSCLYNSRLYVDTRGRFHMCERMNNTFPFGDVENGFDYERMVEIAGEFIEAVKTHCSDCSIRYLCNRCYIYFAGQGEFKLDPQYCKQQKANIVRQLERFIQFKEEGLL